MKITFNLKLKTETKTINHQNKYLEVQNQNHIVLVLIELAAAFETVAHNILISWLNVLVGISGTELKCFRYYLAERAFSLNLLSSDFSAACWTCGLPGD